MSGEKLTPKPLIEDYIPEYLNGDMQKRALDFTAYLRGNKMSPKGGNGAWKIYYKTFNVCAISVQQNKFGIQLYIGEYEGDLLSEELKEIVWANIKPCRADCKGGNCRLSVSKVFGKEGSVCETAVRFVNPNSKDMECIIKLIEIRRNDILEGKAKKHTYIAMKNR